MNKIYLSENYTRNIFLKEPNNITSVEIIGNENDTNNYRFDSVKYFSSIEESLKQKMFTVDCIYQIFMTNDYINPKNGIEDCMNRNLILNDNYNGEISLNLIFEYIARFNFKPQFEFKKEWLTNYTLEKFIDNLRKISSYRLPYIDIALNYFKENKIFTSILPEVDILDTIEQSSNYHKEGNVWKHTVLVTKAIEKESKDNRFIYLVSALLHDLGKALTTYWNVDKGDYSAKNHEIVSAKLIEKIFINILTDIEMSKIVSLVAHHMLDPLRIKKETCIKKADEFIKYGINWEMIMNFRKADRIGRDNGQFDNDMLKYEQAKLLLRSLSVYNMPTTDKVTKENIIVGDKLNSKLDDKIILK